MRPRADEIVHSIAWTFDRYISPELRDPFAKSLGLSIGYLLRSVEQRIRHEAPALWMLNQELRETLTSIRELLAGTAATASPGPLADLAKEVDTVLATQFRTPDEYPALDSLVEEATALRWPLVHAIEALRAHAASFEDGALQKVRERIRGYLKSQLEREAEYVQIRTVTGLDSLAGRV